MSVIPRISGFALGGRVDCEDEVMDTLEKIHEISMRLEHMHQAGDWLSRSLVHADPTASHTGTLITVLVEDLRERILTLVAELETEIISTRRAREEALQ